VSEAADGRGMEAHYADSSRFRHQRKSFYVDFIEFEVAAGSG
jgi:hypothetical protein